MHTLGGASDRVPTTRVRGVPRPSASRSTALSGSTVSVVYLSSPGPLAARARLVGSVLADCTPGGEHWSAAATGAATRVISSRATARAAGMRVTTGGGPATGKRLGSRHVVVGTVDADREERDAEVDERVGVGQQRIPGALHARRAFDGGRVAANRRAVLGQDLRLARVGFEVGETVPDVGVLGHQPQRLPLTLPTDQDRDVPCRWRVQTCRTGPRSAAVPRPGRPAGCPRCRSRTRTRRSPFSSSPIRSPG